MRESGVTLIECLVTLAIVAVLVGLAAPSLSDQLNAARALTGAHQIYTAAQYARSMAQTLETTVTLCPLPSATDANRLCGGDFSGALVAYHASTDGPSILHRGPQSIGIRCRHG